MSDIIRRDPVTGDLIYPDDLTSSRVIHVPDNIQDVESYVEEHVVSNDSDLVKRIKDLEVLVKFLHETVTEHSHVIDEVVTELDGIVEHLSEE